MLKRELQETALSTDAKITSLRFAKQRFGSLTEVAAHIVINVKPLMSMLVKLGSPWSKKLLAGAFSPKRLLLLALIAEFGDAAMRYIRKFDNSGGVRFCGFY